MFNTDDKVFGRAALSLIQMTIIGLRQNMGGSRECWLLIKAPPTALLSAQHQWNKHFGWHSKQPSESHGALASTHHITEQRHHTRAASQRRNTDSMAQTELLKANTVSCVCVNVTYFEMSLRETSLQPV